MINIADKKDQSNERSNADEGSSIKLIGSLYPNSQNQTIRTKSAERANNSQQRIIIHNPQQYSSTVVQQQAANPLKSSLTYDYTNNAKYQSIIQNNLNMLRQFQAVQQQSPMITLQSSQHSAQSQFKENKMLFNESTIKKTGQQLFTNDSIISNKNSVQNENLGVDKVSTFKNTSAERKKQFGETQAARLRQQSEQSRILVTESEDSLFLEKRFNALEIVGQNREIANKVIFLTREIEKLRLLMSENEEENRQLHEKIEILQKHNNLLQESIKTQSANQTIRSQNLEASEQRRQELHKAIENQQKQIQDIAKDRENAVASSYELELKIKQIQMDKERVSTLNNTLFQEKQNLLEEQAKQTLNINLYKAQVDDMSRELRMKNDLIRQFDNDKMQWNQKIKQYEIVQLQKTIEIEKVGVELIEKENQNDQLIAVNKELQETLESLSTKHSELLGSKEIVYNELNVTRETFLKIKSDLTSQVSKLQEENRENNLKVESLTLQNSSLNQQVTSFQAQIKELSKKLRDQDEIISRNSLQIASLKVDAQREKDSSSLETQKQQQMSSQMQELAEVNQQLQIKVKEFQSRYQEQLLKQQQLEFTIQQKNSQINAQADQLKENQVMYNNILQKNQEILKFNEDIQKNNPAEKVIEEISAEKNELMGKLNLLLTENENLLKTNEKLEKQLKNRIEEIDIKKKLLLQFQKENESFRSQINSLPQADRVESLLDMQRSQNQTLVERCQEKEKEVQLLSVDLEQLRIKLIQYQQKEQLLNSEDANSMQTNHFKNKISVLTLNNEKLTNENLQLFDLLKLRKQEIKLLTDKLEKKNQNIQSFNSISNNIKTELTQTKNTENNENNHDQQ